MWVGEGSREKQIKGQKEKKIEFSGNARKGGSPGGGVGQDGPAGEETVLLAGLQVG